MSHLVLGLYPGGLARVPFTPAFSGPKVLDVSALGISAGYDCKAVILPNIAGHVGSDITAVILASDLKRLKGCTVIVDLGTNGEIAAARDGRIMVCSTAAGPAFEGAGISCGMRAAEGAIERVILREDIEIRTIGNKGPIGICGSGHH